MSSPPTFSQKLPESSGGPEPYSGPPLPSPLEEQEAGRPRRCAIPCWMLEGQPARICFTVAFIAFTAAAASWVSTALLSGWMEVAGMVAIGLFYLGLGLLEV